MAILNFLQQDNKSLNVLFKKLHQLNQWNSHLREALCDEAKLADHCQIVNLSGTALIVMADSPHWVTRLRFHIPELLPKLQKYPSLQTIKAICCKVQPTMHPKIKKARSKPPLKLSQQAAKHILDSANKVNDLRLAEILRKIAKNTDDDGS